MNTNITYIHHSCFVWEGPQTLIVFDYWKDTDYGRLLHMLGSTDKQIYFVVSHFHQDHYNSQILTWGRALFAPPRLIVSHDTAKKHHIPPQLPSAILRPGDHYEDEYIKLDAYRSTDIGISTFITLNNGETAFHAGDLNNWYFPEGDSRLHILAHEMEGLFLSTVRDIHQDHPLVNHAMFPLDPRLGKETLRGPSQWLAHIETEHFYPMHTWGQHTCALKEMHELAYLFPRTQFHYTADPRDIALYGVFLSIIEPQITAAETLYSKSESNNTESIAENPDQDQSTINIG